MRPRGQFSMREGRFSLLSPAPKEGADREQQSGGWESILLHVEDPFGVCVKGRKEVSILRLRSVFVGKTFVANFYNVQLRKITKSATLAL